MASSGAIFPSEESTRHSSIHIVWRWPEQKAERLRFQEAVSHNSLHRPGSDSHFVPEANEVHGHFIAVVY